MKRKKETNFSYRVSKSGPFNGRLPEMRKSWPYKDRYCALFHLTYWAQHFHISIRYTLQQSDPPLILHYTALIHTDRHPHRLHIINSSSDPSLTSAHRRDPNFPLLHPRLLLTSQPDILPFFLLLNLLLGLLQHDRTHSCPSSPTPLPALTIRTSITLRTSTAIADTRFERAVETSIIGMVQIIHALPLIVAYHFFVCFISARARSCPAPSFMEEAWREGFMIDRIVVRRSRNRGVGAVVSMRTRFSNLYRWSMMSLVAGPALSVPGTMRMVRRVGWW